MNSLTSLFQSRGEICINDSLVFHYSILFFFIHLNRLALLFFAITFRFPLHLTSDLYFAYFPLSLIICFIS